MVHTRAVLLGFFRCQAGAGESLDDCRYDVIDTIIYKHTLMHVIAQLKLVL